MHAQFAQSRDERIVPLYRLRRFLGRGRLLLPPAHGVHDPYGGHGGRRHSRKGAESAYPATSAAARASCSPNFARAMKRPIPGLATTSPESTITLPRRSTVSTSPTTSVPS